ncbi:MAG: hypothetical protein ACRDRW_06845 [Pseudonocardiaceae bacterium]
MPEQSAGPLKSHRHVLTGRDVEGRNRTVILWLESELESGLVCGQVRHHVVITLDATLWTAVMLTLRQAAELVDAIRAAAGIP